MNPRIYRVTVQYKLALDTRWRQKSLDIDYADTIGEARRDVVGDLRDLCPGVQIGKVKARRLH